MPKISQSAHYPAMYHLMSHTSTQLEVSGSVPPSHFSQKKQCECLLQMIATSGLDQCHNVLPRQNLSI